MKLSSSQIRDLLDSAPDATVIVDAEGRIVFANAQVNAVFGYAPAALVGMAVEILLPERFHEKHVLHRSGYIREPRVRPMGADLELFGQHRKGHEFPIEISLSPVHTDDGVLISSAIRDITERKSVERAIQSAREAAEEATKAKTRFLAAASHDLRQPLQSIATYLGVLGKTVSEDAALEVIARTEKSLDTMRDLLNALLDISKLDSGMITPDNRDFQVQTLFDALAVDQAPAAEEKGLTLLIEPTPAVACTDPALLQRVIENFVSNAIRYTEKGTVRVVCRTEDGEQHIEVTDDGIGIPESSLDAIFEEYLQLDNPVRDRRKGLGLGLAIVRQVSSLIGAKLEVSSTLGKGSCFAVSVPVGAMPAESVVSEDARTLCEMPTDPSVLFVDDDPAVLDAIGMLFDVSGIQAHTAADGRDAIELLESGIAPDMVISDFRLPGANGIEVVRRAREIHGNEMPIALMTGDTSGKAIEEAGLSHCAVLHKPVDTDKLIALIESKLKRGI